MFEELFSEFERVTLQMAALLMPHGYDVSPNAPQTFEALKAHYEATGRVCVWDGASEQTIFSSPKANYAFRAWHDWTHLTHNADFTFQGEVETCNAQIGLMVSLVGRKYWHLSQVLKAEIIGQALYEQKHGVFPVNQRAFTEAYLIDPEKAMELNV